LTKSNLFFGGPHHFGTFIAVAPLALRPQPVLKSKQGILQRSLRAYVQMADRPIFKRCVLYNSRAYCRRLARPVGMRHESETFCLFPTSLNPRVQDFAMMVDAPAGPTRAYLAGDPRSLAIDRLSYRHRYVPIFSTALSQGTAPDGAGRRHDQHPQREQQALNALAGFGAPLRGAVQQLARIQHGRGRGRLVRDARAIRWATCKPGRRKSAF
jgi:hypothetical protein